MDTKTIFEIFKEISDWFIFLNSYLHYSKFVFFPGDEIFRKRSVVTDNSLHMILISEAVAWKFFSMAVFTKSFSNISYIGCKHFVTRRRNLIHNMAYKFKTFKNFFFFFFVLLYRNFPQLLFKNFCQRFQSNSEPKER